MRAKGNDADDDFLLIVAGVFGEATAKALDGYIHDDILCVLRLSLATQDVRCRCLIACCTSHRLGGPVVRCPPRERETRNRPRFPGPGIAQSVVRWAR